MPWQRRSGARGISTSTAVWLLSAQRWFWRLGWMQRISRISGLCSCDCDCHCASSLIFFFFFFLFLSKVGSAPRGMLTPMHRKLIIGFLSVIIQKTVSRIWLLSGIISRQRDYLLASARDRDFLSPRNWKSNAPSCEYFLIFRCFSYTICHFKSRFCENLKGLFFSCLGRLLLKVGGLPTVRRRLQIWDCAPTLGLCWELKFKNCANAAKQNS